MHSKKYIGITLLFINSNDKQMTAYLKSYVVSKKEYLTDIQKISKREKINYGLKFIGIEDFFQISGKINEFAILGKSYLNEHNTISKAKSLLKKSNFNKLKNSEKKFNWFLFSLVYLYEDKIKNDTLAITCLTLVNRKNKKHEIQLKFNSRGFKRKIVSEKNDKLSSKNLKFIGIENIFCTKENFINGYAYQTFSKKIQNKDELKHILPAKTLLNQKRKSNLMISSH